jgi:lipopolysaccharide/colanic/teichoic acid biosynthesis glycosyltransferase
MTQHNFADRLLPLGAGRWQLPWSRRHREVGSFVQSMLLVGHPYGVARLHQQLLRRPGHDYEVIGCCLPTPGQTGGTVDGLPVLGGPEDVVAVVCRYDVDTVAVLPSWDMDGATLRRLESELEPTRADLLFAPAATGTAGPRAPRRPVGGVNGPGKAAFDRTVAALLLVLLAPVLVAAAICLAVTSRGPVLERQERVGRDGHVFTRLRFRTGADAGPSGPARARVVATVRRLGIDELPQLFNVLTGDMSVVGPRPGLPSELPRADAHRRWPVKPGLVGLRPTGDGRRPLVDGGPGDVADYVEHWSLGVDLTILGRSLVTALRGHAPR